MSEQPDFELDEFLPYLLNQAAEQTSRGFSGVYRGRYDMLRTEWRVLVHLHRYGAMTAKEIGQRASIHKTKISRAVRALQEKRFLVRQEVESDRRSEILQLSPAGRRAHDDLVAFALDYDRRLLTELTHEERGVLKSGLRKLAGMALPPEAPVSSAGVDSYKRDN